jgi:hypothetical protein
MAGESFVFFAAVIVTKINNLTHIQGTKKHAMCMKLFLSY